MANVKVITTVLAAAVDTDDTIVFTYPSGLVQADVDAGDEVLAAEALQNVLEQASDTFTVSYGSTSATVTYKGDTSIPANSTVKLQVNVVDVATAADEVPAATTTIRGGVKQAALQADAAGSNPTAAEFDALIDKLVAAGIMAAS